ncbi:hypothetical protein [Nitrosomonas ureae]|uniref:Type I restriction enzyme, S subunit n=1 Tax=Nitrosomonas ureae TaxID=44577 RepID=A0A0S3AGN2_9PROT|nr:hypothetical protein [Nitrosomonas ureae]ALQ50274.1 hypothetical protein ATY38_02930 [Nitrosomonas ureae]PTQ88661.1 hypothetical protein C8R28_100152 [Nitrosomonas ureae]SDT95655.1 type I restriction enzyme, S subunit [Nitrosomonas ureae]
MMQNNQLLSEILTHVKARFSGENARAVVIQHYLMSIFTEFVKSGFSDPKFVTELTSGCDQKFWACLSEALVAERLRCKYFPPRRRLGQGPDFLVMDGTRKVWIEVVCPEPIDIPHNWLNPQKGRVSFPHEQILLRWTSAIKNKAEILIGGVDKKGYLESGEVGPNDAYVIAVNGCRLRSGPFSALIGISQLPFAAEAVFPVGPYELQINKTTRQVVDRGHQHRPHIRNKNKAEVPTFTFLDSRFNAISAIWAIDLNGSSIIGTIEPSAVIHNPNALNPIPLDFLPADNEYVAIQEENGYLLEKVRTKHGRLE